MAFSFEKKERSTVSPSNAKLHLNSVELTLLMQPWNIVRSPINDKTLGQYGR